MKKDHIKGIAIIIISIVIVLSLIILVNNNSKSKEVKVIGNQKILDEIDKIILPLDNKTLTENELTTLSNLVKTDEYASGEIDEIKIMLRYEEYSHIGHSLGFLYNYIKTGSQPICPGHSLSHYYVFEKHGEDEAAQDNLEEAKSKLTNWTRIEQTKNQTYLTNIKFNYYSFLFNQTINLISQGKNSTSDYMISTLAEAPCA